MGVFDLVHEDVVVLAVPEMIDYCVAIVYQHPATLKSTDILSQSKSIQISTYLH